MNLLQYYQSIFSQNIVSIVDNLRTIEEGLTNMVKYMPTSLFITREGDNVGYRIDLSKDTEISYKEYYLLQAVFGQYTIAYENKCTVLCRLPGVQEEVNIKDVFDEFPGMFKLFHAIIFLDFYNSLDFMNNAVALYELMRSVNFTQIPSLDKKETYMKQKEDTQKQVDKYQTEFDALSTDYTKFSSDIDNLSKVIFEIENEISVNNEQLIKTADKELSDSPALKEKSHKVAKLINKIDVLDEKNKQYLTQLSYKSEYLPDDKEKSNRIKRLNKKRQSLKSDLEAMHTRLLDEIDLTARQSISESFTEEHRNQYTRKLAELRENLKSAEERKKQVFNAMSNLKEKINNLKLEVINIDDKIKSECKPVDINRISSNNIVELDQEITVKEKTVRFLVNFFKYYDERGFLTVPQRRAYLKSLFPTLPIKSISLSPTAQDYENFIQVVG